MFLMMSSFSEPSSWWQTYNWLYNEGNTARYCVCNWIYIIMVISLALQFAKHRHGCCLFSLGSSCLDSVFCYHLCFFGSPSSIARAYHKFFSLVCHCLPTVLSRAICIFHWIDQIWQWQTSGGLKNWGLIFVLIKVGRLGASDIKKLLSYCQSKYSYSPGLVRAYLALSKCKDALFTAREAMKVMHQSAKALKLVGDVHAISSSGREKVILLCHGSLIQGLYIFWGSVTIMPLDIYCV